MRPNAKLIIAFAAGVLATLLESGCSGQRPAPPSRTANPDQHDHPAGPDDQPGPGGGQHHDTVNHSRADRPGIQRLHHHQRSGFIIQVIVEGARCAGFVGDGWQVRYRVTNARPDRYRQHRRPGRRQPTGDPRACPPACPGGQLRRGGVTAWRWRRHRRHLGRPGRAGSQLPHRGAQLPHRPRRRARGRAGHHHPRRPLDDRLPTEPRAVLTGQRWKEWSGAQPIHRRARLVLLGK